MNAVPLTILIVICTNHLKICEIHSEILLARHLGKGYSRGRRRTTVVKTSKIVCLGKETARLFAESRREYEVISFRFTNLECKYCNKQ